MQRQQISGQPQQPRDAVYQVSQLPGRAARGGRGRGRHAGALPADPGPGQHEVLLLHQDPLRQAAHWQPQV